VASRIAALELRFSDLDAAIEAVMSSESNFNERVRFLEERFNEILHRIRAPRFTPPGPTVIDRRTYLPLYDGRRFDDVQSQGLQVMVNVAHAVAHQLTALHFGFALPNILLLSISGSECCGRSGGNRVDVWTTEPLVQRLHPRIHALFGQGPHNTGERRTGMGTGTVLGAVRPLAGDDGRAQGPCGPMIRRLDPRVAQERRPWPRS